MSTIANVASNQKADHDELAKLLNMSRHEVVSYHQKRAFFILERNKCLGVVKFYMPTKEYDMALDGITRYTSTSGNVLKWLLQTNAPVRFIKSVYKISGSTPEIFLIACLEGNNEMVKMMVTDITRIYAQEIEQTQHLKKFKPGHLNDLMNLIFCASCALESSSKICILEALPQIIYDAKVNSRGMRLFDVALSRVLFTDENLLSYLLGKSPEKIQCIIVDSYTWPSKKLKKEFFSNFESTLNKALQRVEKLSFRSCCCHLSREFFEAFRKLQNPVMTQLDVDLKLTGLPASDDLSRGLVNLTSLQELKMTFFSLNQSQRNYALIALQKALEGLRSLKSLHLGIGGCSLRSHCNETINFLSQSALPRQLRLEIYEIATVDDLEKLADCLLRLDKLKKLCLIFTAEKYGPSSTWSVSKMMSALLSSTSLESLEIRPRVKSGQVFKAEIADGDILRTLKDNQILKNLVWPNTIKKDGLTVLMDLITKSNRVLGFFASAKLDGTSTTYEKLEHALKLNRCGVRLLLKEDATLDKFVVNVLPRAIDDVSVLFDLLGIRPNLWLPSTHSRVGERQRTHPSSKRQRLR